MGAGDASSHCPLLAHATAMADRSGVHEACETDELSLRNARASRRSRPGLQRHVKRGAMRIIRRQPGPSAAHGAQ
jgi:hypothetical protein